MKNTTLFPSYITKDLTRSPHVIPQLFRMILDERQLSPARQQHVWLHIEQCVACQAVLERYLREVIAYNKEHGEPEESVLDLLTKLTAIMHTTLRQSIPAYVEALKRQGAAAANRYFPQFADHVTTCKSCQLEIESLYDWLQYSDL